MSISRSNNDNAIVMTMKPIQLGEELIQQLHVFLIWTPYAHFSTRTSRTKRIEFIHEKDSGRGFSSLTEEVSNTSSATPNINLHKLRSRGTNESALRLTSHGLCKQGLASTTRTYKEGSAW